MSAFPSPARSQFSYPSSPPPSPPEHSPSGGDQTLPSVRPTATTPPPSHRPVQSLPTPPEDEAVPPRDPSSDAAALEEGVIDLRPGTDYTRCPDVFQYLTLVGKAVGCQKGRLARAERGRRYLEQCAAENKGLFVPPEHYIRSPSPVHGAVRYNKAIGYHQKPFSKTTIWPKLLENHLDVIGETARERLEDEDLDFADFWREIQRDRVVKGLGWHLDITTLDQQSLKGRILLNDPAPAPHSHDYARLISILYSPQLHPLGYALRHPGYGKSAITALLSYHLNQHGFPVARPPYPNPRYDAPWVDWSDKAESEYAKRHERVRYDAWMGEKEAEEANPTLELYDDQWREVLSRKAKSWCRHDEPEGYCEACYHEELKRKQRTL